MKYGPIAFLSLLFLTACSGYDTIIRNGTLYDGLGTPGRKADIALKKDRIKAIGDLSKAKSDNIVDASGLAVAPGFINSLSWAYGALEEDGRSMSGIKQGVTLEIFGEGSSPGPYNPLKTKSTLLTFGQSMQHLADKGVSCNIASFVGATTVRIYVIGEDDREPNPQELAAMQNLVRQSMQEGALGLGTSLIYPPAFYAKTEELIALAKAAAEYEGVYISHLRSEGDQWVAAVDELLRISKEADIAAEIYHLKAAGQRNWPKWRQVIEKIERARRNGQTITTNMYTYPAASTGLDACVPPSAQDGGKTAFLARLASPESRAQIVAEIEKEYSDWENFLQLAGDPNNILLVEFGPDSLQRFVGKTLGEAAQLLGLSPAETVVELLLRNGGDIGAVYFLMSEENVKKQLKLPYMSFGSDARSIAAEGENLRSMTHPRTYGNFARLLGKYVREEQVLPMEEAIHKLTGLAADKLRIPERGKLLPAYYADVVVFDPATIADKATYQQPHQYSEGMVHVWVNGVQVLQNGKHTGAKPGRFVKGAGSLKQKIGTLQTGEEMKRAQKY